MKGRAQWWSRVQIDASDAHLLDRYCIYLALQAGLPCRLRAQDYATGRRFQLARLIMNPPADAVVDHINGDIFDNRRCNLRVCTRGENAMNRRRPRTSGGRFKGINRLPNGKWQAKATLRGRQLYLGCFESDEDAARAYDAKARELFGEFAALNFPGEGEISALDRVV